MAPKSSFLAPSSQHDGGEKGSREGRGVEPVYRVANTISMKILNATSQLAVPPE